MPAPSPVAPPDHGRVDIAIAGGGLSGGLIALAVQARHPDLVVALVEAGDTLGGNHRWSWFESDLDLAGRTLLAPFRTTRWDDGYDVRFPAHRRTLPSRYRSLASADFHAGLLRELNQGTVRTGSAIAALDSEGLTLADGTRISARTVIDCRGISQAPGLTGGWQVFMGRHMRTRTPHGVERPVIMDATVAQQGGYRFVYVLPLGVDELFVEDTYYADSPELDRRTLGARIEAYVRHHGWEGEILGNETGVLPVITGGDFGAFQAAHAVPGVAQAGARGGFVHPLTSYTLPQATRIAALVADNALLPGDQLAALLASEARRHWSATGFYRLLGSMLMGAAQPSERYKVFERFYRLPTGLIERFYAARSTLTDKARVLAGKPPVPVTRALSALTSHRPPLVLETR